jgi:hypothetical protein
MADGLQDELLFPSGQSLPAACLYFHSGPLLHIECIVYLWCKKDEGTRDSSLPLLVVYRLFSQDKQRTVPQKQRESDKGSLRWTKNGYSKEKKIANLDRPMENLPK